MAETEQPRQGPSNDEGFFISFVFYSDEVQG